MGTTLTAVSTEAFKKDEREGLKWFSMFHQTIQETKHWSRHAVPRPKITTDVPEKVRSVLGEKRSSNVPGMEH